MRENPALVLGVIVFVVGAFVGSIFLVYGLKSTGGGGPREGTVVAVVEGEEISYGEYLNTYNNQVDFYRQFYPSLSLSEIEERFGLKERALDTLVSSRLLLKEAEGMGLKISDEELRLKIEETAAFHEGGRFDPARYRQVLAASRVTPQAYEDSQRAELLLEKVRAVVSDAAQVTEEEVREVFRKERDKVRLTLLPLPVGNYRSWVTVTEDELLSRFEESKEAYTRPERIRLAYLSVSPADFEGVVAPTEEELKGSYEENQDSYERPEQVRARHILIKVPEGASEEDENAMRERMEYVLEKVQEGADFAELAREFSQDGSGPSGGDLGYFGRGQMVPAFEETAFSLSAGEVSGVVRTEFGFHVIKVEDVREAGLQSFEDVRETVEEEFRRTEIERRASELAELINDELFDGDFTAVAETHGLEVKRAERITREDLLPGLGFRPDVSQALFELEKGEVSQTYRERGDYYVYLVEEKTPSYLPDFEEARGEIREDFIGEKASGKAREEAESLLGRVRGGLSFQEAADSVKVELKETALFGQSGFVPEAAAAGEAFAGAFRLSEGEFGGPLMAGDVVWLFRVAELEAAPEEDYAGVQDNLRTRLRKEKQDLLFESWLRQLREVRSVEIDETQTARL